MDIQNKDWELISLRDLIDIRHGFAFKGEFFRDEPSDNVLLTPGNFAIGGGFKGDKLKYYVGPIPEGFVLEDGDLVVTMTDLSKEADTLGYPAIVPAMKGLRFLHNQRLGKVIIIASSKIEKDFLYYLLQTQNYRREIIASATGTTVKHTAPERIKAFNFHLPPVPEQRAITQILRALDDKIELNYKVNETLGEIARTIFKSWFIDFEPVHARAEGRTPEGMDEETAALFPDSFVDSESGEIPRGWDVGKLGEIGNAPRRGVLPEEVEPSTPYIGLEHMPRRSIALSDWGTASEVSSNKFKFNKGEILFGKLRPYFHKVGIAVLDGVCSTDILVVIPKENIWFGLLLSYLSSDAFISYVTAASTGTKMPRTNWNDMARYQIVLPTKEIAEVFNRFVFFIVQKISNNIGQSRTLATIRDALLPKLMSGEIRVKL